MLVLDNSNEVMPGGFPGIEGKFDLFELEFYGIQQGHAETDIYLAIFLCPQLQRCLLHFVCLLL